MIASVVLAVVLLLAEKPNIIAAVAVCVVFLVSVLVFIILQHFINTLNLKRVI